MLANEKKVSGGLEHVSIGFTIGKGNSPLRAITHLIARIGEGLVNSVIDDIRWAGK
jgi:hypothetical protein